MGNIKDLRTQTYKGYTIEEAAMALWNAGYKDVTEEANAQNKRTDFAAFEDTSGVGVHYCEFDYDIVELALDTELLTIKTPLKEAIRCFWNAEKLLGQAQAEDHDPFVIENRKEDVKRYEALIEQLQEQTTTLVLTGEGDCDYGDHQVDLGAIEMLLQKGIIHECLSCEEREDLADCYNGDHREFHLSGDHSGYCIDKALHEYDPARWPEFTPPHDEEVYDCRECGIVAIPC